MITPFSVPSAPMPLPRSLRPRRRKTPGSPVPHDSECCYLYVDGSCEPAVEDSPGKCDWGLHVVRANVVEGQFCSPCRVAAFKSQFHDFVLTQSMLRTWCSRAGRRRATWKWFDLLVNSTGVVISMLRFDGAGSEVTREIWEMRLLTLWPGLELGGSGIFGKNVNHVIWKPWFACVRVTCCFDVWLQSHLSTLLQLGLRSQSLCGPWFASLST